MILGDRFVMIRRRRMVVDRLRLVLAWFGLLLPSVSAIFGRWRGCLVGVMGRTSRQVSKVGIGGVSRRVSFVCRGNSN